jgi:Salmonella virulence plasmid 65kDa B protein
VGASTSGSPDHYELWEGTVLIYSGAALTFTPPTRTDNSVYAYKARGCNSNGCGDFNSPISVAVLYIPGIPGPIDVPAESGSSYVVTWASGAGVTSWYVLDESTTAGVWNSYPATTELPPPTSMAFANKAANTYSYRVKACNASGCSDPSAVATTQVVPPNLTAIADDVLTTPTVPLNQGVGTIPGSPGVEGGSATYNVPIEIPPGRAGMQPNVALSYSSKNGDGVVGVGWTISGKSDIYACPNTVAQDGAGRPVEHDSLDKLCYDGARLVLASGSYGAQDSEYRTEVESFDRVTLKGGSFGATGTYFQVEHKSGRISQYEPEYSHPSPAASYHLRRTFDAQGNCIAYKYTTKPRWNGDIESFLASIVYTGVVSGTSCPEDPSIDTSLRSVNFVYSPKGQVRTTYSYHSPSVSSVLLTGVYTSSGMNEVRYYQLLYNGSLATNRPLLSSVQAICVGSQCSAAQLPPTTFTYQQSTTSFVPWHAQLGSDPPMDSTWRSQAVGDLDGDGINELLFAKDTGERNLQLSSCGLTSSVATDQALGSDDTNDFINTGSTDLDFDGRVDLFGLSTSATLQLTNLRCSGSPTVTDTTLTLSGVPPGTLGGVDIDGDGIPDVMYADTNLATHVVLHKDPDPTHWSNARPFVVPAIPPGFKSSMMRDMNGDGTLDFVYEDSGFPSGQHLTDVISFFYGLDVNNAPIYYQIALDQLGGPSGAWLEHPARRWIDVNGDGLPDIFDPDFGIWINKGGLPNLTLFEFHPLVGFNEVWQRSEASFTMDVDNDGQQELMIPNYRVHDYCGGNPHATITNAYFDANPAFFCGSDFDEQGIPKQWISFDHSVFAWTAYRFVEEANVRSGNTATAFAAVPFPTSLQAPAHMDLPQSDVNGTGNTSVHYRLLTSTYQFEQTALRLSL